MLIVKTNVGLSKIHGLGLFAKEHIAAGTVIWKFQEGFDRMLTWSEVRALPKVAYDYIDMHAPRYGTNRKHQILILLCDDFKYANHSTHTPNMQPNAYGEVVAVANINQGDEMLAHYQDFHKWLMPRRQNGN